MAIRKTDISEKIGEWIDAEMAKNDGYLPKAAEIVADRVIREGHAEELVREHGTWIMVEVWQAKAHGDRDAAHRDGDRKADPGELGKEGTSLLDIQYSVDGRYMTLGDMHKGHLRMVQKASTKRAETALRDSHMFSRLADNLKKGETVRARFTDEQVRSMRQEFHVE